MLRRVVDYALQPPPPQYQKRGFQRVADSLNTHRRDHHELQVRPAAS